MENNHNPVVRLDHSVYVVQQITPARNNESDIN